MSIGVFQAYGDDRPMLNSTAVARGRLVKKPDGAEVAGLTGVFTLKRGATVLIDAAAMVPGTEYGDNFLKYQIGHALLNTEGATYTWIMRLTETATGYVSERRGKFTL